VFQNEFLTYHKWKIIWKNYKKKSHQPKTCQGQKNDIIGKRLKDFSNKNLTINTN
jgi:hypothetical protein